MACAGANDQNPPPPATGSVILNGQISLGVQWSNLNTEVSGVAGDVVVQGQAAGNAMTAVTFDDTHVTSNQDGESLAIGTSVNANVSGVGGSVSVSGQASCNSVDVSTDPNITAVDSTQYCGAKDPSAEVNASVNNVAGDILVSGTAVGNNFTEDTNALSSPTFIRQANTSNVASTVNAIHNNVGGSVSVTSSAIGNNAQIVHYSTTP